MLLLGLRCTIDPQVNKNNVCFSVFEIKPIIIDDVGSESKLIILNV